MTSSGLACVHCFKLLERPHQTKYCSKKCSHAHAKALYRLANPKAIYTTATVGAMHELIVAVDLMKRGYHIFRALSASCPGDLIALMDSKATIVEVTTGSRTTTGTLTYPKKKGQVFDTLAVVEKAGTITYFPDLEVPKPGNPPEKADAVH